MNNTYVNHDNVNKLISILLDSVTAHNIRSLYDIYIKDKEITNNINGVRTIKGHLKEILSWFDNNHIQTTEQLNMQVINDFIHYCKTKGNKNISINRKVSQLKFMFNRLIDLNIITINPLHKFKKLPEPKTLPKIISLESVKSVLAQAQLQAQSNRFESRRNYMLLLIIFESGVRLEELININVNNINFANNSILLSKTKTNTDRYTFYTDFTMSVIKSFIDDFKITTYLGANKNGSALVNKRNFRRYLEDIANKLNIVESISPHKWRHTFATNSVIAGANLFYVKETLGHASIKTTEIYTHVSAKFQQEQHKEFNMFSILKNEEI